MNLPHTLVLSRTAIALLALGTNIVAWGQSPASRDTAAEPQADETVVLSAFVVQSDRDSGYQALSTLAGTRLNTPLSDLGAPISVITKEFLEDTGVTGLSDLFVYTTSTESAGLGGNFSGTTNDSIPVEDDTRRRPDGSTRVRGLAAADRTRDYFLTDFPIEHYNVERVDISRGPNAILFGLGSPAGVVNTTLIKPFYGRDAYKAQMRMGDHESYRGVLDANTVIIPQKLAVRMAGLAKNTHWQQNPTFERDNRLFAAVKANPFRDTTITAHYEAGNIKGRRPLTISPQERISPWFLAGKPTRNASLAGLPNPVMDATVNPRFNRVNQTLFTAPSFFGGWALVYNEGAQSPQGAGIQGQRTPAFTILPDKIPPSRLDWMGVNGLNNFIDGYGPQGVPVEVFDFRRQLFSGETGFSEHKMRGGNITIEQHFLDRQVGVEVAYDSQAFDEFFYEALGIFRPNQIQIDVNTHFVDGRINPNFARPFVTDNDESGRKFDHVERETVRATGYATFDAADHFRDGFGRWLGRHTLTGFYSQQNYDQNRRVLKQRWGGDSGLHLNQASILNGNRAVHRLIYVGPSLADLSSLDQVRLDFNLTTPATEIGQQYPITYWDRNTGAFQTASYPIVGAYSEVFLQRQTTDSQAIVLQSNLLSDNIVTVFGWRRDEVATRTSTVFPRFEGGDIDADKVTTDFNNPRIAGEIKTYSVVGKLPQQIRLPFGTRLAAHYSQSENFQPIAGQVNIFADPIAPPTGQTKEYGFSVATSDNRASLRFNWYETDLLNARTSDVSGGTFNNVILMEFQSAQLWYDAINSNLTSVSQANIDRLISSVPEGLKRLVGFTTVTNADGSKGVQYAIPSGGTLGDVTNLKAKGFEFEGTLNPTDNWRISVNVAEQETRKTNTAPFLAAYIEQRLPVWTELGELPRTPTTLPSTTFMYEVNRQVITGINSVRAKDGVYSAELRRWRVNFVNNYMFDEHSRLKGFGIGGAWRWQDNAALSYRTIRGENGLSRPDIDNPYYTEAMSDVDLWVSYQRKLFGGKVRWKLQLNVGNVFADGGVIPASYNGDGTTGMFRATAPRTWALTSTFEL